MEENILIINFHEFKNIAFKICLGLSINSHERDQHSSNKVIPTSRHNSWKLNDRFSKLSTSWLQCEIL